MDLKSLKSFDWRSLRRYASPKAAEDLNLFLERLPQDAGKTMLVIAGVAWAAAGGIGLYTTMQLQQLTKMRAELQEAGSLKPMVPVVKDMPVDKAEVDKFAKDIANTYGGLKIKANGSAITIAADSTGAFGQFREAIGHVQNGGSGWHVSIDRLCVGRECGRQALEAVLKINKVSVNKAEETTNNRKGKT